MYKLLLIDAFLALFHDICFMMMDSNLVKFNIYNLCKMIRNISKPFYLLNTYLQCIPIHLSKMFSVQRKTFQKQYFLNIFLLLTSVKITTLIKVAIGIYFQLRQHCENEDTTELCFRMLE